MQVVKNKTQAVKTGTIAKPEGEHQAYILQYLEVDWNLSTYLLQKIQTQNILI